MSKSNKSFEKSNAQKYLTYAKFAIAGAMGGLAVVNTIFSSAASSTSEGVAMGAGAVALTVLVKALHVL